MEADAGAMQRPAAAGLPARFFAALGMGIGSLVAGATLIAVATYVMLSNPCPPCTYSPLLQVNGTLLFLGILLTLFGLGFLFITLLSVQKRWV